MTDVLDAAAAYTVVAPAAVLEDHAWLGAAIDDDARAGRFASWGRSTVVDENTGSPVLSEGLFVALHARADIGAAWPVGNAGLLHVYGYLLSTVLTPYGLKRARWLDGTLALAYGLAADEFVPWARERTLLDRVTHAASDLLTRATVRTSDVGGVPASVALGRAPDAGSSALAYRVGGLLATTFPVASPESVLAEWDAEPARLRWNSVIPS